MDIKFFNRRKAINGSKDIKLGISYFKIFQLYGSVYLKGGILNVNSKRNGL